MKKIEAILRPARLGAVKEALAGAGGTALIVGGVRVPGRFLFLPPQVRLELTVRDEAVEEVSEMLLNHARTGEEGDGKIFVLPAPEARRARTGEAGEDVL